MSGAASSTEAMAAQQQQQQQQQHLRRVPVSELIAELHLSPTGLIGSPRITGTRGSTLSLQRGDDERPPPATPLSSRAASGLTSLGQRPGQIAYGDIFTALVGVGKIGLGVYRRQSPDVLAASAAMAVARDALNHAEAEVRRLKSTNVLGPRRKTTARAFPNRATVEREVKAAEFDARQCFHVYERATRDFTLLQENGSFHATGYVVVSPPPETMLSTVASLDDFVYVLG